MLKGRRINTVPVRVVLITGCIAGALRLVDDDTIAAAAAHVPPASLQRGKARAAPATTSSPPPPTTSPEGVLARAQARAATAHAKLAEENEEEAPSAPMYRTLRANAKIR
ncbi:hypothetical protein PG996_000297 [Apiospora saccharicola]|uniref:Uncharacterized protein n=1 Tax=Apiospora saccharicola TaxID=335842 RepID=A0ABR1WG73_9PEZI